jgi:hypothetical protein
MYLYIRNVIKKFEIIYLIIILIVKDNFFLSVWKCCISLLCAEIAQLGER